MKCKLIDGTAIVLAGVVSYDSMNTKKKRKKPRKIVVDFDFDIDINKDDIKKIAESIKTSAKQTKEAFKTNKPANEYQFKDFESSMKTFGKNMEDWGDEFSKAMGNLGEKLSAWGKSFEANMEGFDKKMDRFGQDMDRFGDDLEKKVHCCGPHEHTTTVHVHETDDCDPSSSECCEHDDQYDKHINKHWDGNYDASDYNTWELEALFNDIYANCDSIKDIDTSPDLFYEIQSFDLPLTMRDQMTFIGCQIDSINDVPHPMVVQRIKANKWLVLKLTVEEYQKDWLSKVEDLDMVKGYNLQNFFIIRHFKDHKLRDSKKIKIYVPLEPKNAI